MKRLLLTLGVLGMALGLGCSIVDWHNDIEYPVSIGMSGEKPGNPITLNLQIWFDDQTPDTSGVEFNWSRQGDTLRFMLEGTDGDIDYKGPYFNVVNADMGVLDKGVYTLIFEGEGDMVDTLSLTVEDSLYHLVGDSSEVIKHIDQTLRRIFPDMLLVEAGYYWSQPYEENLDSLNQELLDAGAKECPLTTGVYLLAFWNWLEAFENDWLDETTTLSYTFDGDTSVIGDIFNKYENRFMGLGIGMGNGFRRLYEAWNNY